MKCDDSRDINRQEWAGGTAGRLAKEMGRRWRKGMSEGHAPHCCLSFFRFFFFFSPFPLAAPSASAAAALLFFFDCPVLASGCSSSSLSLLCCSDAAMPLACSSPSAADVGAAALGSSLCVLAMPSKSSKAVAICSRVAVSSCTIDPPSVSNSCRMLAAASARGQGARGPICARVTTRCRKNISSSMAVMFRRSLLSSLLFSLPLPSLLSPRVARCRQTGRADLGWRWIES